ncbi:LOB domain-containing protein 4-like [Miscanthus floridulus]|uniref:LOB domain-containing protein 4-like n=1 Tax=Miscanthus floridulus TaxID=154761 RepID=UPI00345A8E23
MERRGAGKSDPLRSAALSIFSYPIPTPTPPRRPLERVYHVHLLLKTGPPLQAPRPPPAPRGPPPPAAGAGAGARRTTTHARRGRKCDLDCPLAPYLPADQQSRFTNAQRLFGTSNIQKTLTKYGPAAMRSLIYQWEVRAADPIGGCVGIIKELRRQVRDSEMELQFVRQQIAICRQQASATDGGGLSDPAPAAMIASSPVVAAGQQDNMVAAVDAICARTEEAGRAGPGEPRRRHLRQNRRSWPRRSW